MTIGPVHEVVALLAEAGYESVDQPQPISGVPFAFDAMLVGHASLDLIAVVDLAIEPNDERIRRKIEGLARALDLVQSRRSLTVVLAGPLRRTELVHAISGVARVLAVGTPLNETELREALAVLLPLSVSPEAAGGAADEWVQAQARLRDAHPTKVEPILTAAAHGHEAVKAALATLLAEPLAPFGKEGDE